MTGAKKRPRALVLTFGPAHERPWWWKHLDFDKGGCEVDYQRISIGSRRSHQVSALHMLALAASMVPFMLKARSRYDYVLTFECDVTTFIVSLLQTLTFSRRPRHVVLQFIMREKRRDLVSRLKYLFMKLCFSSVHKAVCSSVSEAEYYREVFAWNPSKACFAPMHTDPGLQARRSVDTEKKYIVAAGRTFRDYDTLVSALSGTDIRAVIVASPQCMPGRELPENVSVLYDIDGERLRGLIAECAMMVLPLKDRRISTGQSVMLEAMAMGKAVIATRTSGTVDYIEDRVNGVLVEPGNPEMLREEIKRLYQDPHLRKVLGENAMKAVEERYLPQHYYENVARILGKSSPPERRG